MKATEEQIQQWRLKYGTGNIIELRSGEKYCYIYNPIISLEKWKLALSARRKSTSAFVDCVLNNCWISGDESFKSNDALKLDIEDQVDDLVDIPESETEDLQNGNVLIRVEEYSLEVRKAGRLDIRYAEDRNKENKPLITQIHLLDRIAIDVSALDPIRKNPRVYAAFLFAANQIKDTKDVEIKKF